MKSFLLLEPLGLEFICSMKCGKNKFISTFRNFGILIYLDNTVSMKLKYLTVAFRLTNKYLMRAVSRQQNWITMNEMKWTKLTFHKNIILQYVLPSKSLMVPLVQNKAQSNGPLAKWPLFARIHLLMEIVHSRTPLTSYAMAMACNGTSWPIQYIPSALTALISWLIRVLKCALNDRYRANG